MFDHAQWKPASRAAKDAAGFESIFDDIALLGFDPPQRIARDRSIRCGTSFRVSVGRVLADECAAAELLASLRELSAKRIPVCLVPDDFPVELPAIDAWTKFCELLQAGLSKQAGCHPFLSFCMHSHRMPLDAFCLITDSLLGVGPRYVYLDSLQMAEHGDARVAECTASNWRFLWRHRNHPRPVQPVYGGLVRSTCRLLADEVAAAVIPTRSLLAPAGSAWLPIGLPITRFCSQQGALDWQGLQAALRQLLNLADRLLPALRWHDPRQRADASTNRRVAVCVTGLGDLLLQSGRSPGALESLNWLTRLVRCIQKELSAESARRAATGDLLPALAQTNPVLGWAAGKHRERWLKQWEIAVSETAVRHRNLLVLSPSSVLPDRHRNCAEFADLLPVLGFADAWSFDCNVQTQGFKLTQFIDFHRRARATIQSAQRASFVAAGV